MTDFTWTSPDGVDITLPSMDTLPAGVYRRHRNEEPASFVFSVLEEMSDEENLAKADEIPLPQIGDLFVAWQKAAGATVPQS